MRDSDLKDEVMALLDTQGLATTWDQVTVGETILPTAKGLEAELPDTLAALPCLTEGVDELEIGSLLGEGGMGIVHTAYQRSLDRDVAVKQLKPGERNDVNIQSLLREARLTGSLEHPNIIPVHILGRDADGALLFAMKRMAGTSWQRFFEEPELAAERSLTADPLEFHLNVLMQVCQAAHFAHSRGVVHRDIKPANVGVGDFGEVYLLDWGIAVRVDGEDATETGGESTDAAVQSEEEVALRRSIAGTPAWMAPEMVAGDDGAITPRTDVYLLGGVLHSILTGQPRHRGKTLPEVLVNAIASHPVEYDDSVSPELGAIANRATHPKAEERFESADEMRRAIGDHLLHRASERLGREAELRLDELRELTDVEGAADESARHRIYPAFSEARFGFQQALIDWEENVAAREGLQQVLELMIDFEIGQRNPAAAAGLLSDLPEPNSELQTRIEQLERRLDDETAEVERLRRVRREIDVKHGTRTRSLVSLLLALVWGVPDTVIGVLEATGDWYPSYPFLSLRTLAFCAILGVAVAVRRDALLGNIANRRIIGSGFILMASQLLIWLIAWRLSLPLDAAATVTTLSFGVITALMAVNIDTRIWPSSLGFFVGAAACVLWPELAFAWLGISAVIGLVAFAIVWRERE